jgi:hypothetical protein
MLQNKTDSHKKNHTSEMFWAGWSDEEQEGSFSDVNTGEILNKSGRFWPFFPGEPNGETNENCVAVWSDRRAWNDLGCSGYAYGFCNLPIRPRFKLRGKAAISSNFL